MTDQTPATEAGRRHAKTFPTHLPAILAVEAEARAEHWNEGYRAGYSIGRADALREAAERVRALAAPKRYENDANGNWFTTDMEYGWDCGTAAVLAVLQPRDPEWEAIGADLRKLNASLPEPIPSRLIDPDSMR